MILILAHRRPSREQRPHRTVVVTAAAILRRLRRNNSHAPVRFMPRSRQLADHGLRLVFAQQVKPHRHGCENRRLIHRLARLIQSERVSLLLRDPERLVQQLFERRGFLRGLPLCIFFPHQPRKIRQRLQRCGCQATLINLGLYREQRSAFHPAMTNPKVLGDALGIVGGMQVLVSLPHAVPLFPRERHIPAGRDIVVHPYDIKGSGIGGNIWVGIILEPVHQSRRLRNLMRDFSILALKLAQKFQRRAGRRKISLSVKRERSPHRVAPEKPRESRPLTHSRGAVPGNQARPEKWIVDQSLQHADA